MNHALTAIIIAIGGTSLIFLLVSRHRRGDRARSRGSAGSDSGYYAGDDNVSLFGWTGTHHSSFDHAASEHCGGSHDAGSSGDSGGGDSGGGGGDGGSGGSD